jgi:hypothetical protein
MPSPEDSLTLLKPIPWPARLNSKETGVNAGAAVIKAIFSQRMNQYLVFLFFWENTTKGNTSRNCELG